MKRRSATAGLDGRGLNPKALEEKNAELLLPFLFPGRSGSDENLSSEEKEAVAVDKDANVEAGRAEKDDHESDSEESQADEETKILEPEEPQERSRSKTSNKSTLSYGHESGRRSREGPKSRFSLSSTLQDEAVLKHLLQESNDVNNENDNGTKDTYRKPGIGDLASSLTEYCPELCRIMQQQDPEKGAREIATQTSLPLEVLEMEELTQSIDEIINSRNCSSKGTQISPKLNKGNNRRTDDMYR